MSEETQVSLPELKGWALIAVCAGVTETPAAAKIPGYESMKQAALRKNPYHRLTTPEDVASALVALSLPATYWLTGNVLYVDGAEAHCG